MIWQYFSLFAGLAAILWLLAIVYAYYPTTHSRKLLFENSLVITGIAILVFFASVLWVQLDRPPMRTLGETRLWYALFLPIIGIFTYNRWRYKWFLAYSLSMSVIFLIINYLNPQTYTKTLMPALQSVWFVPHVIVYIFAYAVLAAASLISVKGLYLYYVKKKNDLGILELGDNLVYIGFSFLTLGLLFGALWAKEAWGHYWTWDPKETWAFLTWMGYLLFIHYRHRHPKQYLSPMWILAFSFVILLIAWFGVNYLPSAQQSVHTYTDQP